MLFQKAGKAYKFVENAVPGKMIGGDLYKNKDGKLPKKIRGMKQI